MSKIHVHVPVAETVASIGRTARLWRLGGLTPWQLIVRSVRGYRENHFDARSAQFAYYSMLSLFPLLILLIAALAQLPLKGVLDNALDAAGEALPEEMDKLLTGQIHDIQARSTFSLLTASLGVLAIAGSQVFLTITEGLNRAYGVVETRKIWRVYGLAFLLTVAASLLLLVAVVLMIVGPMLSAWLATMKFSIPYLSTILQSGVRWGVVCACLWIYTATIYCLVPNVKLPWYWFSPGSAFAVVGWVLASQGFRLYVENLASYNTTYGALGGVIVLIVWLNLTGAVLLMGGQINGVIHRAEVAQAGAGR
ncbi:MAG: YihY/virulence factor BrkB family protein [Planctomycetia bacterium]|nr:YihY/virulence factor BrkB family protein [Planctomycetia bacterium]